MSRNIIILQAHDSYTIVITSSVNGLLNAKMDMHTGLGAVPYIVDNIVRDYIIHAYNSIRKYRS